MAIVSNNLYAGGIRVNPTPIPAGTPYVDSGLASDILYVFTATNINDAGLESPQSAPFTFRTAVNPTPPAQSPLSDADKALVDAVATGALTSTIPGIIISVTGPRGYYTTAHGYHSINSMNGLVTTDDHFRIGSATKSFCAMCFWQAVDDGLVALTDTVEQHLPGACENSTIITMEHLLTHRSGVYDYTSITVANRHVLWLLEANPSGAWTEADTLALIKGGSSQFTPGSKYTYCNSNAILIGAVVEAVRGKTLRNIMIDDIFGPLGMTETTWLPNTTYTVPSPAMSKGKLNVDIGGAAGALTSNAADMTKWCQAIRDGALLGSSHHDWVDPGTWPSVNSNTSGTTPPTTWDYGHFLFSFGSWIGHDGSIAHTGAAFAYDTATGATITVAINADGGNPFFGVLRGVINALYPSSLSATIPT